MANSDNTLINKLQLDLQKAQIEIDQLKKQLASIDLAESENSEEDNVEKDKLYLESLLNGMPDLIFIIDKHGVYLDCRTGNPENLAFRQEDFIGKSIHQIFPEEEAQVFQEMIDATIQTKSTQIRAYSMHVNGELGYFECKMNVFEAEKVIAVIRDITKRQKAENALNESQLKFKQIIDHSPDIVYRFSSVNGGSFHSPKVFDVLGYTHQELSLNPQLWMDSLHPDDVAMVQQAVENARNGKPIDMEYRIKSAFGKWVWLHDRSMHIEIAENETIIDGLAMDITDKKLAEEKAIEAQKTYEYIFNAIPEAVYIQDAEGVFIDVNDSALKLYGCSKEYLIGKTPADIAAPGLNDLDYTIGLSLSVMKTGIPVRFNFWAIRVNGEIFVKEVIVNRGKYFGQQVLIATARDMTLQKDYENQLEQTHQRMELAAEAAKFGIWEYDLLNNKLYWDKWMHQLYGIDESDFKGYETWMSLANPDDLPRLIEGEKQALLNSDTYSTEFNIRTPKGESRHIKSNAIILRNDIHQPYKITGINFDITDRKNAEDRMRELTHTMLKFGSDKVANINQLVALLGTTFLADSAVYNKLTDGLLCSLGQWKTPLDYNPVDKPDGHICFDVIKNKKDSIAIINDLHNTSYQITDPNVSKYGLKTYIGVPVKCKNKQIGSLCILYQNNFLPTQNDIDFIKLVGHALSSEEERMVDEIQLLESEHKHKFLFEKMAQGVVYHAADGSILDANPAALEILGLSMDQILGLTSKHPRWDTIHEDKTPFHGDEHPATLALKNGKPVLNVVMGVFHLQSQKYRWILINAIPEFKDNNPTPTQCFATFTEITEVKESKDKLRQSEQQYKNLQELFSNMADIMPDLLWAKDLNRNFIFANKAICQKLLIAESADEVIGKNDMFFAQRQRELYPDRPDWHTFGEICCDSDSIVLTSGQTGQFDEFGNVQGEFLFLDVVKTPLRNENGEIIGVVGSARDVTINKQAAQQLKESQANLKAIIENSLDNIWSINLRYEIDFVNDVFFESFKNVFSYELKKGQCILDALPPGLSNIWKERYDRAFAGEQFSFLDEIVVGDQTIYIEVCMRPILVDNIVKGASFYGRDITTKIFAEKDLQYQSDFRYLLMELSSNFINVPLNKIESAISNSLAQLGAFVGADRAYIFDYYFDKGICVNSFEWCSKGTSPQIDNLQNVQLSDIPDWTFAHQQGIDVNFPDISALPNDGLKELLQSQEIKSLLTIPLMSVNECIGFVGFDSVNHHHTYNEFETNLLHVYSEMLVNAIDRKNVEIQLIRAKEKAEESDRLKSAFLANMSHEIRTPMNGILGFTTLLNEPDLTGEERQEFIKIITKAGERLVDTVNDLIDVSKIETGQMKVVYGMVNVEEELESLYSFFVPQAREKSLNLSLNMMIFEECKWLYSDRNKLNSILTNLIKNSIKYTDTGDIEIGCSKVGEYVQFSVKDTGIGVPENRLNAIFNRFEQADFTDTHAFEGSGLGLAISKAYVEMLGGKIWVESEVGKGSNFYFTIPLNDDVEKISPGK